MFVVAFVIVVAGAGFTYSNAPLSLWSCDALRAEQQRADGERAELVESMRSRPLVSLRDYEADLGYPQSRANAAEAWGNALSDERRHRC